MKNLFIFLFTSFFSFQVAGQENYSLADTTSTGGRIIERVKHDGFTSLMITNKRTGKKYRGYRLCANHYVQIDSLSELLSDLQIDTLLSCNNGTLKTVGFILYSKRHNNKKSIIKKLREILNQEYIVMTSSCSDAIQFSSLGQFNYDLLTQPNFFLKPNFNLTREDKVSLESGLAYYELCVKCN